MRRGGGPPQVVSSVPTTLGLPFPQCATEVLTKLAKHVRLCGNSKHRGPIAQLAEFQQLLDNDVFCLTQDQWRITKLNAFQQFVLLDVLMRFFKDKVEKDDPNRGTYFDLIFLGREGEKHLHDQRIDVLMNFASYALQAPIFQIYPMICQYLSNTSTPRSYGEKLVALLVDHFIKRSSLKQTYVDPSVEQEINSNMHQFLLPLETKCQEFNAYFLVYAHRYNPIDTALATVMGRYMNVNCAYLLSQFKESAWMAEEFAKVVFPKCLAFVLDGQNQPVKKEWKDMSEHERFKQGGPRILFAGLLQMMQRWHTKVKDYPLDLDPVFDKSLPWSRRRKALVCAIACLSPSFHTFVRKNLERLNIPKHLEEEMASAIRTAMISSA